MLQLNFMRCGGPKILKIYDLSEAESLFENRSRREREGGPIEELRPGDVIWFPPGEKHWHGATPGTAMTHIAIHEQLEANVVTWMEKVSDEQYRG